MDYQQFVKNPSIQAFLLAFLFLYFIFRGLQLLNQRFVFRSKQRQNLKKLLYFIEFISWLIFIIESVSYFASNNIVISGLLVLMLFIVVGWTSWYIIKDYVAGLYLKWNNEYKINEIIDTDGQSGKIIKLGSHSILLEISPLHTTKIRYSQLFTKKVIKTSLSDLRANASFTINLSKKLKPTESLEAIRTFIYQLPWANFKHKPAVLIEKQDKDKTLIRISASVLDEKYVDLFEGKIREKFE